jgi:glycyl-tRNA synthetase (class II)
MGRSRDINAENVGELSMIEVKITEQMLNNAMIHAANDKAKHGYHNTIVWNKSDTSRLIGSLGEEVISSYFNTELSNTTDYDIIINQQHVEIKTNSINVDTIKPYYECNIIKPSIGCDRYMFVFVHASLSKAWIVGTCSSEEFDLKSYYSSSKIKGRKSFPCHHIKIKDLEDVETWL